MAVCSCGDTLGDIDPRCPAHFPSNVAKPAPRDLTPADVQVGDWVLVDGNSKPAVVIAVHYDKFIDSSGAWYPRSWIKEVRRG